MCHCSQCNWPVWSACNLNPRARAFVLISDCPAQRRDSRQKTGDSFIEGDNAKSKLCLFKSGTGGFCRSNLQKKDNGFSKWWMSSGRVNQDGRRI